MGTGGGAARGPRPGRPLRRPGRLPPLGADVHAGPDQDGAWPRELGRRDNGTDVGPLAVRPLAVDSNVLRDDVLYATRKGHQTSLMAASAGGGLRLFCGPHVPAEVEEHLEEWADDAGLDPVAASRVWRDHHLPFLRCVNLPPSLLGAVERARYDTLAAIDPDDLPTVVLCVVADFAVLTRDGPLVEAVYGAGTDAATLTAFLQVGLSGRRLSDDDALVMGAILGGRLAALAAGGFVGLIRRVPPPILIALTAALAANVWLDRESVRDAASTRRTRLGPVAAAALETFGGWAATNAAATAVLVDMLPPLREREPAGLPRISTDVRAAMRALARANGPASADGLAPSAGLPVARTRVALRETAAATEVSRGRFQLGVAHRLDPT